MCIKEARAQSGIACLWKTASVENWNILFLCFLYTLYCFLQLYHMNIMLNTITAQQHFPEQRTKISNSGLQWCNLRSKQICAVYKATRFRINEQWHWRPATGATRGPAWLVSNTLNQQACHLCSASPHHHLLFLPKLTEKNVDRTLLQTGAWSKR